MCWQKIVGHLMYIVPLVGLLLAMLISSIIDLIKKIRRFGFYKCFVDMFIITEEGKDILIGFCIIIPIVALIIGYCFLVRYLITYC